MEMKNWTSEIVRVHLNANTSVESMESSAENDIIFSTNITSEI